MAKNKNDIIENAVAGGVIGAAIGALLTGKSSGTLASALLGAAIGASIQAQEEAKQLNTPVLYKEGMSIYRVYPDGSKEFVKRIGNNNTEIPTHFTID